MSKNHAEEIMVRRTQHKTPEEEQRAREEAQRQIEANERERRESRRHMFSHFRMWKACPGKSCVRAHACRGDVERCLRERWHPLVPPRFKALLQKTSELVTEGWSVRDAVAAAEADIARHDAVAARAAAPKSVAVAPAPQPIKMPPRVRNHPRGPRIRSLS